MIGCLSKDASPSDLRDRNLDGKLSRSEMGPCDLVIQLVALIKEVTNGTSASMGVSGDSLAASGEGDIWVAPGQDLVVSASFRTHAGFPDLTGNVTFSESDGLSIGDPEPWFDTAGDNVASAVVRVAEDAEGSVSLPYVIDVDGGDRVTGSIPLMVGRIETDDVDLLTGEVEDDGIPGLGPAVLLAALVAVAAVLRRRRA